MTTTEYTKHLADEFAALTTIDCICDGQLDTFDGEVNDVLILHLSDITEVIPTNATYRMAYDLTLVSQPETHSEFSMNDVFERVREYFLELPRYTEIDGAYFLQYRSGQVETLVDDTKNEQVFHFELIVHFD